MRVYKIKYLEVSKAFTEYWNDVNDIFQNVEEFNRNRKCKTFIIFG